MSLKEPPIRLCCGQAHWGVVCLDKRVMCDRCFGRFEMQDLHKDSDGTYVNVCCNCAAKEQAEITRRAEQEKSLLASLPHNGNPGEN